MRTNNSIPWIIGQTPKIQELKKKLNKIANLDCPVLLLGETGTGKELIARTIHDLSLRKKHRFLAVHCSNFQPEIFLKEIFGEEHEDLENKTRKRKGLLETARQGTLFLDEIEHLPFLLQGMLLKVIEKKAFIRYGGTAEVKADVRIIAATSPDLATKVNQNQFREDLYYRLNAISIEVPPLRERKEDIPLLAHYFLHKYNQEFKKKIKIISEEVLAIFQNYSFPGNVRELEYAIERAVLIAEGEIIEVKHLPPRFQKANCQTLKTLAQVEKEYILKILSYTQGNKQQTAKILGISRTSLWRKLKEYNLNCTSQDKTL